MSLVGETKKTLKIYQKKTQTPKTKFIYSNLIQFMYSSQNNTQVNNKSSFATSVSKSVLNTFQNSLQSKLSTLQSFQSELQDKKEITMDKVEAQKQQLQTLVVEIAGFLDDLMLPIVEKNPFYLEDFLIFMEDFIKQVETQLRLFTTLSVSSLRKQVVKTSQKFETKMLKDAFEQQQKQTLAQTELLLETLNEQLIDIRHRIEKQKDRVLDKTSTLSLPSLSVSSSELTEFSEKTVSNFELVTQDIKRFFM